MRNARRVKQLNDSKDDSPDIWSDVRLIRVLEISRDLIKKSEWRARRFVDRRGSGRAVPSRAGIQRAIN